MPITSTHADYEAYQYKWQRCEDVAYGGEDALHDAGETYLPRLRDQSTDDYKRMVARTPLFNASWRTIDGLNGMLFRKPVQQEFPAGMDEYLADVTMTGMDLQSFIQKIAYQDLAVGAYGVLVDYPEVDGQVGTVAQSQAFGLRPRVKLYKAADVYNWRYSLVNNQNTLTEIRLKETEQIQVNEWDSKTEDRYRVLDLFEGVYRVRVYKVDGVSKQEILLSERFPVMNGSNLDYIPFDWQQEIEDPPLIDLINMNLHHYRISSIKCNALPFTIPTMFIAGSLNLAEGEKIYVGSSKAIHSNDPASHAEYIEFSGQGLGAVEKEIDKSEQQMAILGARMLEKQRKAVESSDTQQVHRKGEESILAARAQVISQRCTRFMGWFAEWAGFYTKGNIEVNRDFYPVGMTAQMLTALMSSWQQGGISDQVLFDNLQAAEIISDDTTFEDEQQRIGDKTPVKPII
jgi:hypothetical protein